MSAASIAASLPAAPIAIPIEARAMAACEGATGGTADFMRRAGETPSTLAFVASLRLWS
jgi:hypothetical protein